MPESGQQGLKAALRDPGGVGVFWFALGSPSLIELALPAGPQAIALDLQHGMWRRDTLEYALGLVPEHIPAIVRLANGSAGAIGEALDAGAECVLAPLVESAGQAMACVDAAHYPPHGRRSGGGIRPLARGFAAYVEQARARTTIGVMIETKAGVEQAKAIANVPGLDFVFIGTGDLALSLDCFPAIDERHEAACRHVLETCQAARLPCGIFTTSAEDAAQRLHEGYALVVVANDIGLVASGFQTAQAAFSAQPAKKGLS
jgi:2-keto-3-deoxy-L-rhamnonate aldolase RhmA